MKTAEFFEKRHETQMRQMMRDDEAFAEESARLLNNTKDANNRALERVRALKKKERKQRARDREAANREHVRRVKIIMEFKKSVEKAHVEMKKQAQKKAKRDQRRKKKQAEEFDKILSEGKNPYEVFRQRKIDADLKNQKHRSEKGVAESRKCLRRAWQNMTSTANGKRLKIENMQKPSTSIVNRWADTCMRAHKQLHEENDHRRGGDY